MGEVFLTIFIFFGVIAITAVVFGGWVVVSLVKLVIRGLRSLTEPAGTQVPLPLPGQVRCARMNCAADNPRDARFCRRCGAELPDVQHVQVRRAAVL
jgi:hypothetical protein